MDSFVALLKCILIYKLSYQKPVLKYFLAVVEPVGMWVSLLTSDFDYLRERHVAVSYSCWASEDRHKL